jgi:hypothetical protein
MSANHICVAPGESSSASLEARAVMHNMGHDAMVIWFQPGGGVFAGLLNDLVVTVGNQGVVAGSCGDMDDPVAVTGWGNILQLAFFSNVNSRASMNRPVRL